MIERWLPVVGHPNYEVSNRGRVRSIPRVVDFSDGRRRSYPGQVLRPADNGRGYLYVNLDGKSPCVHKLVLEAFVGPRPEGMAGCHNDGDPLNNRLSNLRWDTYQGNSLDVVRHGRNRQRQRTHCPRQHPLVWPNLVPGRFKRTGHRVCYACSLATWKCRRTGEPGFEAIADAYYAELMRKAGAA